MKINPEVAKAIGEKIGIDWDTAEFDLEDFEKGLRVEMEHGLRDSQTNVTSNNALATGKIALAHLKEAPDYYKFLDIMEKMMKSNSADEFLKVLEQISPDGGKS